MAEMFLVAVVVQAETVKLWSDTEQTSRFERLSFSVRCMELFYYAYTSYQDINLLSKRASHYVVLKFFRI